MIEVLVQNSVTPFASLAKIRKHTIAFDEHTDAGGLDTAPSPFEALCSALAACTAITLRMYAMRKKWEIGKIDVKVVHSTNTHDKSNIFSREIRIEGNLDEAQRQRVLAIAQACPVHKALEKGNLIQTTYI